MKGISIMKTEKSKWIAMLLALILALSVLAGCSSPGADDADETPPPTPTTAPQEDEAPGPTAAPEAAPVQVGDVVQLGWLDWRVIELRDGKALVISEYVLDDRLYNEEWQSRWDISEIRSYLNGEFFDEVFSAAEQAQVCETNVINGNNPWNEAVSGGSDTRDKVFLLSLEETVKYFGDSGKLANKPDYEEENGFDDEFSQDRVAYNLYGDAQGWWLRSPGNQSTTAAFINYKGFVNVNGNHVQNWGGVRPALWLKLDGPAQAGDHDPVIERQPETYVTINNVFAIDIPYGLAIEKMSPSGTGDNFKIESWLPRWTMFFYEQVPSDGGYTYDKQKDVVVNDLKYEITPMTIAGKEGYYFLQGNHSPEVFIDVKFPNPVSDKKDAIYGVFWLFIDPIEGYETGDYLEIPEIKAILGSIRAPE